MTRRACYRKVLYYDEDFVKDINLFEELIMKDKDVEKLKLQNKLHRFSAVIRWFIRGYNKKKTSQNLGVNDETNLHPNQKEI